MGITLADVLRLPSLNGAEVLAGRNSLFMPVESVTVLEYGNLTEELDQLFKHNKFEGNELIITAFANIVDNVDAQCENIRRYHNIGAVGFLLYYVGVLLPEVDRRLIDLCDELDFPLICMPKGQLNLRYSEAISEIWTEILYARQRERYFVSEFLQRMSNLPPHQRNLETLLRMLSDHLHVSAVLTDPLSTDHLCVCWPRSLADTVRKNADSWIRKIEDGNSVKVPMGEGTGYFQRCPVLSSDPGEYRIYLLKYDQALSEDILWQTSELIRLFIHIWHKNYGKLVTTEIVRAIINGEVVQMMRLSQIFHIDVSKLNQMWLFHPRDSRQQYNENMVRQISENFSSYYGLLLTSYYEENLLVFTCAPQRHDQRKLMMDDLSTLLVEQQAYYEVVCCDCLSTPSEIRRAYLDSVQHLDAARKIYPQERIISYSIILFAKQCQETMAKPEELEQYLGILKQLREANDVLIPTIGTYLLDASSNMAQTAKALFVHLNTIKYRLHLIQDLLGYDPGRMPDAYPLYMAAALDRLIQD